MIYNSYCNIENGLIVNNNSVCFSYVGNCINQEKGVIVAYRFMGNNSEVLDIPILSAKNFFVGIDSLEEFENNLFGGKDIIFKRELMPWFPEIVLRKEKKGTIMNHFLDDDFLMVPRLTDYITIKNPYFVIRVLGNDRTAKNMAILSSIIYNTDCIDSLHITSVFGFSPAFTNVANCVLATNLFDLFGNKLAYEKISDFLVKNKLNSYIYADVFSSEGKTYIKFNLRHYIDYTDVSILNNAYFSPSLTPICCVDISYTEGGNLMWGYDKNDITIFYGQVRSNLLYNEELLFKGYGLGSLLKIPKAISAVFSKISYVQTDNGIFLVDETYMKSDISKRLIDTVSAAIEDIVSLEPSFRKIIDVMTSPEISCNVVDDYCLIKLCFDKNPDWNGQFISVNDLFASRLAELVDGWVISQCVNRCFVNIENEKVIFCVHVLPGALNFPW